MKVGICDDSEAARCKIAAWLTFHTDVPKRNVLTFRSGEALLEYLRFNTLDIVFLDGKMDGIDGISTAEEIRKRNSDLIIIMVTDFVGYARFGYGADVFDYILKDEFQTRVGAVFESAVLKLCEKNAETIVIRTGSGLFHLKISEILFMESHARKKEFLMRDGRRYEFYGRIDDIEQTLRCYGFVRPHNSYLVNGNCVRVVLPKSLYLDGYDLPIPVSRGKYKTVLNDITVFATESCL